MSHGSLSSLNLERRPRASDAAGGLAVDLHGVTKRFGEKTILAGVDLQIERGEFVVLLGPSGTGKTTLLRILAGLDVADEGSVLVAQARTTVYQEPRLIPSLRVLSNVMLGQTRTRATEEAALKALNEVGLASLARVWPGTLSGGEAQRVALARALVREPELLLLDEPFAALDALTRLQMQDLVRELVGKHQPAVLLVTHDVDEALCLADRILILRAGKFVVDFRSDERLSRDRDSTKFIHHRKQLLRQLGVVKPFSASEANDGADPS